MRILDLVGLTKNALEEIKTFHDIQVVHRSDLLNDDLTGINIIFGWNEDLSNALKSANSLRFIQSYSDGVDYFPLDILRAKQILLANTSGMHAVPIAESVVGYTLAFARGIFVSTRETPVTFWRRDELQSTMFTLKNTTAVIFGTGHIGQKIAQYLTTFGMTVLGVSHHGRGIPPFVEVGTDQQSIDFAKRADVIINIMPLTTETTGFFNKTFFSHLSRKPLFINVGRGASVVTDDLVKALENRQLSGAALDVYETEPVPNDSPLWGSPNLLMTPHVSGRFSEMKEASINIFMTNLKQWVENETLAENEIDLNQGY